MNALVASVIRTLTPIIVGHIAGWLLLINVTLPDAMKSSLELSVGGVLAIIYYVGVRVLEQQWPSLGLLLGVASSPDSYSKGDPALKPAADSSAVVVNAPATAADSSAPAVTFPKAAVDAAVAAEPAPAPTGLDAPIAPAATPTV